MDVKMPANPDVIVDKETLSPVKVNSKDLAKYLNEVVKTTVLVVTTRVIESNNKTLSNVGAAFFNQDFTIMIRSENRDKFDHPETRLKGKTITIKGLVIEYKEKPEIALSSTNQLIFTD